MWLSNNYFKYSIGTLIALLIIYMFGKIDFFIAPFKQFLGIIFLPILIAGLLYYIFRPMVRFLQKIKIPLTISIAIIFVVFIILFSIIFVYAGTIIWTQFQQLLSVWPQFIESYNKAYYEFINKNENIAKFLNGKINDISTYIPDFITVKDSVTSIINAISSIASIFIIVPFILFFFLKDDSMFAESIIKMMPKKYRKEIREIMEETDRTLSAYILGQAFLSLIMAVLSYIGFVIIQLDYAFILSFFIFITSFIPMFGALIGVIPAFLVALAVNPIKAVLVLVVMLIVSQFVGNIIMPNIIGKSLDIHPLTVILIFIGATALYGVIGMLIAVPAYAVLKISARGAYKVYKIWKCQETLIK